MANCSVEIEEIKGRLEILEEATKSLQERAADKKRGKESEKMCPLLTAFGDGKWYECEGEACAWWDDERQQCVFKTIADNIYHLGTILNAGTLLGAMRSR